MKQTIDTTKGKIKFKDNVILSDTWQTLEQSTDGLERFSVKSRQNVGLWLKSTINDSDAVAVRLLCYLDSTSVDPYMTHIQTIGPSSVELAPEVLEFHGGDFNAVVPLGISELVPYLEIQVKVNTAGIVPAELVESYVTFEGAK